MTIKSFGPVDERAKQQLERCATDAVYAVLCADHHPGYSQPIGGAVAYEHFISPSGVGYDIGCGNKAVRTNLKASEVDVSSIMDEIVAQIGFGVGRPNPDPVDHPVLQKIWDANFKPQRRLLQLATSQLGTVGAGNHYVDLFEDENGDLWIGVHFGSRALDTALPPVSSRLPEGWNLMPRRQRVKWSPHRRCWTQEPRLERTTSRL